MKIDIPPITKPLDLGDYAEELRGVAIHVWVNCPRSFRDRYWQMMDEAEAALAAVKKTPDGDGVRAVNAMSERISAWVAELWSASAGSTSFGSPTAWTAESVSELANSDTDPGLYPWALNRSWAMISEHRDRSKKK